MFNNSATFRTFCPHRAGSFESMPTEASYAMVIGTRTIFERCKAAYIAVFYGISLILHPRKSGWRAHRGADSSPVHAWQQRRLDAIALDAIRAATQSRLLGRRTKERALIKPKVFPAVQQNTDASPSHVGGVADFDAGNINHRHTPTYDALGRKTVLYQPLGKEGNPAAGRRNTKRCKGGSMGDVIDGTVVVSR
jgi:hypothetical protein